MSNYQFNPLQMAIKPLYEKAQAEDELFAQEVKTKESRTENPKSLAQCADYIMGEAYKYASEHRDGNFGLAGCDDAQIIDMIKHYYDEDDIVINKVGGAKASVKAVKEGKKPAEKPVPMPTNPLLQEMVKRGYKPTEGGVEKTFIKKDKTGDLFATINTKTTEDGTKTTTIEREGKKFTMTEFSLF